MKKLLVVLAVLFIGILLAGCTTQPAAPVATPTPTPVPTTVATPVPTTVAPTQVVVVIVKNVTPNVTATAVPTPVPSYVITFTQDLTVVPGTNAYIKAGTKVIWMNNDPYKPHGISSQTYATTPYLGNGVVSIPYLGNYTATFDKAGTYAYTTEFQPQIAGTIYVS